FECIKHHYNDKSGYNANIIKQIKHIEDNFEVRPYRDIIEPVLFYMSSVRVQEMLHCLLYCSTQTYERTCTATVLFYASVRVWYCTVLRKCTSMRNECSILVNEYCYGNVLSDSGGGIVELHSPEINIFWSPEAFKDQETSSFSANNDQSSPNDQYDDGEDVENGAVELNDLESERVTIISNSPLQGMPSKINFTEIRHKIDEYRNTIPQSKQLYNPLWYYIIDHSGQHTPTNKLFDMNALNESIRDKVSFKTKKTCDEVGNLLDKLYDEPNIGIMTTSNDYENDLKELFIR
ncbi:12084_t:CDS:2, partial [Funneliformis caledonium]